MEAGLLEASRFTMGAHKAAVGGVLGLQGLGSLSSRRAIFGSNAQKFALSAKLISGFNSRPSQNYPAFLGKSPGV